MGMGGRHRPPVHRGRAGRKRQIRTAPPGSAAAPAVTAADLGEDIDNLPPVTEATLCLLPQKPGVLHGYWVIPPNTPPIPGRSSCGWGASSVMSLKSSRKSPCRTSAATGISISMNPPTSGEVYLQLGYYEADGRFRHRHPPRHRAHPEPARLRAHRSPVVGERKTIPRHVPARRRHRARDAPGLGRIDQQSGRRASCALSERLAWPGNISSPHEQIPANRTSSWPSASEGTGMARA